MDAQLELVLLGAWLGALVLFGLGVAPAAFAVAPTPGLAGDLVGRVLRTLDWAGFAAGLGLAARAAARRGRSRATVALPLLMSAACLVSQLVVTPKIAALRSVALGPAADPSARAQFGRLHALSVGLFAAVALGACALVWLHLAASRAPKKTR